MSINISEARNTLADFKDPFNKSCIDAISTYSYKGFGDWTHTGTVKFKNGNTGGEQKFKGKSLADVLRKMEAFVETL